MKEYKFEFVLQANTEKAAEALLWEIGEWCSKHDLIMGGGYTPNDETVNLSAGISADLSRCMDNVGPSVIVSNAPNWFYKRCIPSCIPIRNWFRKTFGGNTRA